jgi:hypothetical protein
VPLKDKEAMKDPFTTRTVAFSVDGDDGIMLQEAFGNEEVFEKSTSLILGKKYLFGSIIRKSKRKKTAKGVGAFYDVEWEHSSLGVMPVDSVLLVEAMTLGRRL